MAQRLEGHNAVVTGAGRGIGRAAALLPAAQVAAEVRDAGGSAVANYDDVSKLEGGENTVRQCVDAFGRIDILVNVAGILRDRMIFHMSEDEWDAVIAVHLKGPYNTIKPASVLMRQQRHGR